jgi:hypothetical protein
MDIYVNDEISEVIVSRHLSVKSELEYGYIYTDPVGVEYKLTRHWSEMFHKELDVLQKLPMIGIEELINIIPFVDVEKAVALAIEIQERKFDNSRTARLLLLQVLEEIFQKNKTDHSEFEKIRLCIYETSLYDPTNRDKIVGKTYTEINKDAKFYREVSDRARKLLDAISEGP